MGKGLGRAPRWAHSSQRGWSQAPGKKVEGIEQRVAQVVEADTAGDPCGPLKWVRQSLRQIQATLAVIGVASTQHPARNRQFRYLNRVKHLFLSAGHPVISVDTKKKELIGNYKSAGATWRQQAERVNDHDFPAKTTIRSVPYGIYDIAHNQGYVYVGTSGDTADLAVDAIQRWYERPDRAVFEDESKLLIFCDAGGRNGYRVRNWKQQIQLFADAYDIDAMICHYPIGASKWNPIEHRLFSMISLNWAGKPLRSLAGMTALIRGTTTTAGLTVKASQ